MLRNLFFAVATVGVIQPAFAGRIDIELDLNNLPRPAPFKSEPGISHGAPYVECWIESTSASPSNLDINYDAASHKLRVTGLTTEYYNDKPDRESYDSQLRASYPIFKKDGDNVSFLITTAYVAKEITRQILPRGVSFRDFHADATYVHTFKVTFDSLMTDDQTIKGELYKPSLY